MTAPASVATTGPVNTARALCQATVAAATRPDVVVAAVVVAGSHADVCTTPGDLPADALFEIGSVTKTVTGTLLAFAAGEGLVRLEDPIGRWLDAGDNAGSTMLQLATHTSGLPKMAGDAGSSQSLDPYRDLTADRAVAHLRRTRLRHPGRYLYSNFGYQLLGRILELASASTYADLVRDRVGFPEQRRNFRC